MLRIVEIVDDQFKIGGQDADVAICPSHDVAILIYENRLRI